MKHNHVAWDLGNTLIYFKPHGTSETEQAVLEFMDCVYGTKVDYTRQEKQAMELIHRLGKQQGFPDRLILLADGSPAPDLIRKWYEGRLTQTEAQTKVTHQWQNAVDAREFENERDKNITKAMLLGLFDPALLASHLYVIDEGLELLKRVHKNSLVTNYILSNFDPYSFDIFHKSQEGQKLFKLFDPKKIVISGNIGLVKPHWDIYQYFLKYYNMQAHSCIFIDNQAENIASSKACGIHGILLKNFDYKTLEKILVDLDIIAST